MKVLNNDGEVEQFQPIRIKNKLLEETDLSEEEAECAIQEAMNEYELKGYYTRELSRTPRIAFEHEADEKVLKAVKEVMKPYIWTVVGDKVYLTDEQLLKIMAMLEHDII